MRKEPFKSIYSYERDTLSRTTVFDDGRDGTVDYCDQFKAYLRKGRLSDRLVKKFIDLIVTVVDYNIQLLVDVRHRTVFQITDTELLAKYYSILMRDDVFATQNLANARIPEAALLDYIEFAKTIPLDDHTSRTEKAKEEDPIPPQGAPVPDDILVEADLAQQNKRHELIRQAQLILQPIEEYLKEYRISEIVTFEYYGSFQDVNVIAPRFKKDIGTEAEELEALVVLMKKYQVEIPAVLRERQKSAKMLKELKDTIRSFENWLVGYMIYLTLKRLEVDSIYYSPSTGFRICLSGKGIDPTTIKIKTCIVDL